jgi:hypothetical protein
MRFSIRELMAYTAAVCVMLTLTRLSFVVAAALLAVGVAVAYFAVPTMAWRYVVYGGISGVVVLLICLLAFLQLKYGQSASYRGSPAREVMDRAQPFVMPLGSLLGGTLGLALWKARRRVPA